MKQASNTIADTRISSHNIKYFYQIITSTQYANNIYKNYSIVMLLKYLR